ncbi:hypothetical protein BpHYR1_050142 [Brachionus plicatilis]|uniref:Uncharacterized protein n=1 Tax=Brachionus plicatilis TaxID=10195 RepID=A0A3M7Q816_BRAPC|nr:hypothetical protein BpHYR1_050142 [Brachionus plicatilis]
MIYLNKEFKTNKELSIYSFLRPYKISMKVILIFMLSIESQFPRQNPKSKNRKRAILTRWCFFNCFIQANRIFRIFENSTISSFLLMASKMAQTYTKYTKRKNSRKFSIKLKILVQYKRFSAKLSKN